MGSNIAITTKYMGSSHIYLGLGQIEDFFLGLTSLGHLELFLTCIVAFPLFLLNS